MTRQARVGAFAIIALLLLFGVFYVITDFGTRHTGYRVGVHFRSAAGLTPGAIVYFSGVNVGSVDSITLLPDNSVDVILAVNRDIDIPAASKFLIQAPLTGSPNLLIVPPANERPPVALLPRQVLPVEQQPQGTNTATIADLLQQGQGEVKRFDVVMSQIEARTPKLLDTLQTTLNNANDLTLTTKNSMHELSAELLAVGSSLQNNLSVAGTNIDQLTTTLNGAATTDSRKLSGLLDQLNSTALALNKSMGALQSLATNPQLKANVISTTQSIAQATQNLAELTADLRSVTGDPQTQAQMRNTIANLDATMQKANSLLGELGGTSNVYGVDAGATPAPVVPSASPYPAPGGGTSPGSPPSTAGTGTNATTLQAQKRAQLKLGNVLRNLIAIQLRLSGLSVQQNPGLNPVLTKSQGPLGDLNLLVLPHASTSLMVGANSIGNNTTYNAVLLKGSDYGLRLGGGVLYSQIGVMAQYNTIKGFGLETRIYDLTYPMIDLYGNLRVTKNAQFFFGQRDMTHASRRNTLGFQYTF
ncbi:MAG: MCE family protein [Candidatus Eremiobacteraeota bacterium]|nr:MCE family protein [Candidatus Eremiobacteraeota bacterium]